MTAKLTIGPVLFYWPAEQKRDFYYRVADETNVDTIYVGEVICSKRAPFFDPYIGDVIERIQKSGKTAVLSTLSEVMIKHDRKMVKSTCEAEDIPVEANDASALLFLSGRPHRIGQLMNVYNEDALAVLNRKGANHVCLPPELPAESIETLSKVAQTLGVGTEIQVHGRVSLALSARCYHARAHGRIKDNCQYACEDDPDGMPLKTVSGQDFLSVNGIQTLSHTCLNLMQEMADLESAGLTHFRISPHTQDIVKTVAAFESVLLKKISPQEGIKSIQKIGTPSPFSNGFYYKKSGHSWIEKAA